MGLRFLSIQLDCNPLNRVRAWPGSQLIFNIKRNTRYEARPCGAFAGRLPAEICGYLGDEAVAALGTFFHSASTAGGSLSI